MSSVNRYVRWLCTCCSRGFIAPKLPIFFVSNIFCHRKNIMAKKYHKFMIIKCIMIHKFMTKNEFMNSTRLLLFRKHVIKLPFTTFYWYILIYIQSLREVFVYILLERFYCPKVAQCLWPSCV